MLLEGSSFTATMGTALLPESPQTASPRMGLIQVCGGWITITTVCLTCTCRVTMGVLQRIITSTATKAKAFLPRSRTTQSPQTSCPHMDPLGETTTTTGTLTFL